MSQRTRKRGLCSFLLVGGYGMRNIWIAHGNESITFLPFLVGKYHGSAPHVLINDAKAGAPDATS